MELSAIEYRLLCHLAGEPTRVFTREELLRDVWGYQAAGRTRTLDSHACRLRAKLSCDTHRLVINVWGVGLIAARCLTQAAGSPGIGRRLRPPAGWAAGSPSDRGHAGADGQAIGGPLGRASRTAQSHCQSLDRPAP